MKIESRCEAQWWGQKCEYKLIKLIFCCVLDVCKAVWCNGCEAGRVDCYTRRRLSSSNPLRTVTTQTIDIFIRGCYL